MTEECWNEQAEEGQFDAFLTPEIYAAMGDMTVFYHLDFALQIERRWQVYFQQEWWKRLMMEVGLGMTPRDRWSLTKL